MTSQQIHFSGCTPFVLTSLICMNFMYCYLKIDFQKFWPGTFWNQVKFWTGPFTTYPHCKYLRESHPAQAGTKHVQAGKWRYWIEFFDAAVSFLFIVSEFDILSQKSPSQKVWRFGHATLAKNICIMLETKSVLIIAALIFACCAVCGLKERKFQSPVKILYYILVVLIGNGNRDHETSSKSGRSERSTTYYA